MTRLIRDVKQDVAYEVKELCGKSCGRHTVFGPEEWVRMNIWELFVGLMMH